MDETNDPRAFLEGLDEAIGEVYADLYAAVDRAIEQIDGLMDVARSFINAKGAEEVKVHPGIYQKLHDLKTSAEDSFNAFLRSLVMEWIAKIDDNEQPLEDHEIEWIKARWNGLDERYKSYVRRSPDSPL